MLKRNTGDRILDPEDFGVRSNIPMGRHEDSFIQFLNLTKSYREGESTHTVLRNLNARICEGEFVAILGKSGSGKSTLLNLVSGIDDVDDGSIRFNGVNLTALSDHERTLFRRQNIGFIFQFLNLIPTLTVLENVMLPLELNEIEEEEAKVRAEALIEAVGLVGREHTFPDRLSGGEQQRVAIARALVHNPLLILADEPTGNLDETTGEQVLSLLDRLTRQSGKNLILVTHSKEAASYADRILILQNGELIEGEG
jgi:putative ABC transport system ATP-binding protein